MKVPTIMGRINAETYNNLTLMLPFEPKGRPRESYEIALGHLNDSQYIYYIAHYDGARTHFYRSERLTEEEAARVWLDGVSKGGVKRCHTDKTLPQDELRSLMVSIFQKYVLQAVDETLYKDERV